MGSSDGDQSTTQYFISYSRFDQERALALASALERAGIPVWIDRTGITGGDEWADVISRAIRAAARVIVLCSDQSLISRNVRRELQLAWDYGVSILPVLLEPVAFPDGVSYFLHGVQWIELYQSDGLERLIEVLSLDRPTQTPRTPGVALVKLPPHRPLIGRDEAVRELVAQVADARERLVTIVGPGGIGKTVLAVAVAEQLIQSFRDGVVFVDLTPIRTPDQVITAISQALEIGSSSAMMQADRLPCVISGQASSHRSG